MRLLLAGMTLACLGQVAHAQNRYGQIEPAPTPSAAAPAEAAAEQPAAGQGSAAEPTAPSASEVKIAEPPAAGTPDYSQVFAEPAPTAAEPQPATTPMGQPFAGQPVTSQPAGVLPPPAQSPAAAAASNERSLLVDGGPKPSELMRKLMKAPANTPLAGAPLTLGEAVRESPTRQAQTQRAKAYWDLSAATADYYLAVLESQELSALRAAVAAPGKSWEASSRDLETRVEAARRSAQAAQLQLHQLLGGSASTLLPLPADVPHCGRYNAEYDEIFASRPDPVAKKLAEVLALRHTELRSMTQAIADAETGRAQASQQRNPASDGTELLNAQQLLSLQRRAFIARAREYNQEIAAYTELAAPAEVAPDRLVAMMIRASTPANQQWGSNGVEPASAVEDANESEIAKQGEQEKDGARPTFFAEGHHDVRRPLQRLLGRDREHSIVVSRLRKLMDRD